MVDDPSEYVDVLLSDPATKRAAQRALKRRRAARATAAGVPSATGGDDVAAGKRRAAAVDAGANGPSARQALGEMAAELERARLFGILEELVQWRRTRRTRRY